MKTITKIWYNFAQYNDGNEAGETYELHAVGNNGVTEIKEHIPAGVYGLPYFEVNFINGFQERIYTPNRVFYEPSEV